MLQPRWIVPPSSPAIDGRHIHLWRVPLDVQISEAVVSVLAPEERRRRERFLFEDGRRRFTVTRATLRRILGGYLGIDPGAVRLAEEERGKPHLEAGELQFNVSHSHELALVAVALGRRVGVDLERQRTIDAASIIRRWFSEEEKAELARTPERFLEIWTMKEAQLKAVGRGVWDIGSATPAGGWSVMTLAPAEGFIGAIAVEGERDWELDAFDVRPGHFPAENRG